MDTGSSPSLKYSHDYQSGALSFEIISNGKKLITNCGYYKNENNKLNKLSRSTATHSTLIIDDDSSCHFKRENEDFFLNDSLKIIKKDIIFNENYWKINASHNGYLKKYNITHEREIEYYPEQFKFIGNDKILNKKENFNIKFDMNSTLNQMLN